MHETYVRLGNLRNIHTSLLLLHKCSIKEGKRDRKKIKITYWVKKNQFER